MISDTGGVEVNISKDGIGYAQDEWNERSASCGCNSSGQVCKYHKGYKKGFGVGEDVGEGKAYWFALTAGVIVGGLVMTIVMYHVMG